MDYKDTLNLPQTDFPMKANLAVREPELLKKWDEMGLYERLRGKKLISSKSFCSQNNPIEMSSHH